VALEITLRLLPVPERHRTVLAAYHSLEAAGDAVAAVVASGLLPGAMEIMDRLAIEAAEAAVAAGYPRDAAALLIVELDGEADAVEADFARLEPLIRGTRARPPCGSRRRRRARGDLEGAQERVLGGGAAVPGLPGAGRGGSARPAGRGAPAHRAPGAEAGLRVANVFHAGDGNLHPLILFDGTRTGELERAEELAGRILRLCIELGGSITGEHGVGLEKRAYLPEMFPPDSIAAMWRLRSRVDPQLISNPGKMFPGGEPAALAAHGLHPLERAGVLSRV
jgi:glycolate oxidase